MVRSAKSAPPLSTHMQKFRSLYGRKYCAECGNPTEEERCRVCDVRENAKKEAAEKLAAWVHPDEDLEEEVEPAPTNGRAPDDTGARYMPTPEQIRAACAEIQSTWSETQRAQREQIPAITWAVPASERLVAMGSFEGKRDLY